MNSLDNMEDWEKAKLFEKNMKPSKDLALALGVNSDEYMEMGRGLAKLDYIKINERLKKKRNGKYIAVTAMTPTPLGEGKTTTTIGLIDGLAKLGKKATGAIRQPSCGPTFNIKGSGAGGGLSQCIPLTELSIKATGDIDCITNAHNLSMVALTSRLQHETNYDDERLKKLKLKRLDIDSCNIKQKWVMDFCAQSLRNISIGHGGKMDGVEMDSGFQITASSELMAILSISKNLEDLRGRLSNVLMAYSKEGKEITANDLEVDGAMAAWLVDAMKPNLLQTLEYNPLFVHAGPFANIAIGQSSIIADQVSLKLSDYHVTESGFGADIGYEKFWNLKCRLSGLKPDAVVIVATIRALKMHGGGPLVKPGKPLDKVYEKEALDLVEKGCSNLVAHIDIVKKSGITPIVCINHFKNDTDAEVALVKEIARENGAHVAVSKHWSDGGKGAIELAEKVIEVCEAENDFSFLYDDSDSLSVKIEKIAKEIYGAIGVSYSEDVKEKLSEYEADSNIKNYNLCMAKTHLSLSHNPDLKGQPKGWTLPIEDILMYKGAEFIIPVIGKIKLMPGTGSSPAFKNIDVDVNTGDVTGIF